MSASRARSCQPPGFSTQTWEMTGSDPNRLALEPGVDEGNVRS
jgi:hypothetical protein